MLKVQSAQAALTSAARPEQLSAFNSTATQHRGYHNILLRTAQSGMSLRNLLADCVDYWPFAYYFNAAKATGHI